MIRKTVVVQGQLAFAAHRAAAARGQLNGLQILTVSQLASRLAGGFLRRAITEEVEDAVRDALDQGGFEEIEGARHLPGMTRAITRTLGNAWNADLFLADSTLGGSARVRDIVLVEARLRSRLPPGALLPPDLRHEALKRVGFASAVLGEVSIVGVHFVEPVWRPLLDDLRLSIPVTWVAPAGADTNWFSGSLTTRPIFPAEGVPVQVTCADPRHEVLEALRWARQLLASGRAKAGDIAISSATTDEWDDQMVALAEETDLRISFPHGRPCLATIDGQRCAALADILLHGLSQARVWRLVSLVSRQGTIFDELPRGWLSMPRNVSLGSAAEWERAFEQHGPASDTDSRPVLMRLLAMLERGTVAADEAARTLLRGRARRLWDRAIRAAPAAALELTLRTIRIEDEQDPADAITWSPAWQLAASPRPWVRLLGLTGRSWPRPTNEDPLLPDHIVPARVLDADPSAEGDRRTFAIISDFATKGLVLSRSRRDAQGALTGPSPLLSPSQKPIALARAGLVAHAASESDRLTARPEELTAHPMAGAAVRCWQNWHRGELTDHDGLVAPRHPLIVASIGVVQSPTSLTRLLRDPLGFVWKYALGWRAMEDQERPLTLPPDAFGTLVHELLRRTVDTLEPVPGFTVARRDEIAEALDRAVGHVSITWPLERAVPPSVLWINTVRQAAEMALAGLTWETFTENGTRSWTEVPFGEGGEAQVDRDWPWNSISLVTIPGTDVLIRGKIDRVDLRADAIAVRVTDYKTGVRPDDAGTRIIAGGGELQRVLYGLACRVLLPHTATIRSRLIYLKNEVSISPLADLDAAIAQVAEFVIAASDHLKGSRIAPGPAAEERYNDLRLALPASPGYFRRKQAGYRNAAGKLLRFWGLP